MKSLVLFYSWHGNAKKIANIIAKLTGADIFEIEPQEAYSDSYAICIAQAGYELKIGSKRDIKCVPENFADYDVVYLGSPIWWGSLACPMFVAVDKLDWTGKKVCPFCTHGGGGEARFPADVKKLCQGAEVTASFQVKLLGDGSLEADLKEWLQKIS
ncbi:MAG: flavodoxin [Phascolarctobacterium sp.]|nr:flavodoxin [Phascolarctobacterium sp.]